MRTQYVPGVSTVGTIRFVYGGCSAISARWAGATWLCPLLAQNVKSTWGRHITSFLDAQLNFHLLLPVACALRIIIITNYQHRVVRHSAQCTYYTMQNRIGVSRELTTATVLVVTHCARAICRQLAAVLLP